MLDIALDQINYMSEVLRIDLIANRIRNYVIFSQKNMYKDIEPLPKHSEKIFEHLLIYGEIPRNSVKDILNISKPAYIGILEQCFQNYLNTFCKNIF